MKSYRYIFHRCLLIYLLNHVCYSKNNLLVFFIAGHDTTALALAYTAYYLAVNPASIIRKPIRSLHWLILDVLLQDIQRKAREEAISVLGDAPEDVLPTLEQTRQLPYINMVIKEVCFIINPS